ncbi:hypothetical protein ANCCAN_16181 [Ancylostoma caninum]|uniref:Uncharacterized protein n=1 Tax=Ancylostoma caninum TaxID=29170 RepID=A0A368G3N7_ANCCA|nr:hypothetical protein ANCCAN_16181 [Ancylostoma caninum]
MYCSAEHAKVITFAIMVLHNILVENVGREALVRRYGTESELEEGRDGREPGRPGNIATDAKQARERLMTFFAQRDGVR